MEEREGGKEGEREEREGGGEEFMTQSKNKNIKMYSKNTRPGGKKYK
jgi:hypothetical protein